MQEKLRSASVIKEDEEITGVVEEVCVGGTLQELEDILDTDEKSTGVILVESVEMYGVIAGMELDMLRENNVMINTKYKTVGKKVKPAAGPLPVDSEKTRKGVSEDPSLRKSVDIRHTFTEESVKKLRIGVKEFLLSGEKTHFRDMLKGQRKAFVLSPDENGCVDPEIMELMVIFMIDHVPWNLKMIPDHWRIYQRSSIY